MADRGTTAVIKGKHNVTGEIRNFVATEGKTMPKEYKGLLNENEQFIEGVGHAEQTIFNNVGDEWTLFEGGSSRNVCKGICQPLIEGSGMELGGPTYRGLSDKTPFRWFWRR